MYQKAKFTIEGYELKQLHVTEKGYIPGCYESWCNKTVVVILSDLPNTKSKEVNE